MTKNNKHADKDTRTTRIYGQDDAATVPMGNKSRLSRQGRPAFSIIKH